MKHLSLIFILLLLISSTGCLNSAKVPQPTSTLADLVSNTEGTETLVSVTREPEPETPAPLPTDTPIPLTQTPDQAAHLLGFHPRYIITATLDYAWHHMVVEQEITIPNTSSDTIPELTLVVQPNWRPDVFNLSKLTIGEDQFAASYTLDGIRLRVLLLDPLDPGETLLLSLAYELNIPPILTSEDFGPNPFGYTTRQINLTDWYPFVPPYISGTGWLVHNPWYYGEHLVYSVADFDVTIQLINEPSGTVIAASALDDGDGDIHQYHLKSGRNFVWSVSPEYKTFQKQVGDTVVLGYAFPYDVIPGEAAFETTVRALELFNQLFGPYPLEGLTVIEADFDHGMEYSGLYFLSRAFYNTYEGTPSSYLVAIAAHETAHQWWYGLVGNDQALEPWLDEALCTYSERLYYEKLFPRSLSWWEYTRVSYYEPTGWVDSSIYNTNGYRPYRDAVYLNGARFLHDLRSRVGDEAFFLFLPRYIDRFTNQIATTEDFFSTLKEVSDADWQDLLNAYFEK